MSKKFGYAVTEKQIEELGRQVTGLQDEQKILKRILGYDLWETRWIEPCLVAAGVDSETQKQIS